MPGKRHTAREMALQMLYQQDLGGGQAAQIFGAFDPLLHTIPETEDEPEDEEAAAVSGAGSGTEPRGDLSPAERRVFERRKRVAEEAFAYAKSLVEGTLRHREEIDELISEQADNWRLERMPAVDRNILRLAVFEMLHEEDVPKLVVVDEAIELAKRFGSEQSGGFINGLLDGLLKQREFPGKLQ